ncbi:hypothetical protein AX774_g5109 [Zancudomyces culisetae]|uniref:Uncharacterized protein n=1 Tax=Zancudomyces culisetae TaxID=1213189 RepID=A0A1R1PKI1_ZANCU|nr:hypothetical protein AX774_g5109 [Zancudomyces culisetae]|eukprot:OMH81433.1 hypothetical protein AX774_g5109 [Zancudomyces culisetae]
MIIVVPFDKNNQAQGPQKGSYNFKQVVGFHYFLQALSDEAVHVKGEIVDVEAEKELISLKAQKESITDQLTIDALEFPLPLASLGYVNLSDGTIGGIGTVTSMMMLRKIIKGF